MIATSGGLLGKRMHQKVCSVGASGLMCARLFVAELAGSWCLCGLHWPALENAQIL